MQSAQEKLNSKEAIAPGSSNKDALSILLVEPG